MGFVLVQTHAGMHRPEFVMPLSDFLSAVRLAGAGSSSCSWALPRALAKLERQVTALRGGKTRRMI